MVILLTVVVLLAFILIMIATFTYVVTYSSSEKIKEEYLHEQGINPVEEFIADQERFAKEAKSNPFATEIPDLDRDDLIRFMENEVREKRLEASRKAEEVRTFTQQLEELLGKSESAVESVK